jgi:NADPH-dependent methylglyoxal reductase
MTVKHTVLVTGASGFVALHIVDALLSKGYDVVAAVRSPSRELSVREVAKLHPTGSLSFVYVTDIGLEGAYDAVFRDHSEITAVIHAASPVTFSPVDPIKDVVNPSLAAISNILSAIKTYGPQVQKFVYTSSTFTAVQREFPQPKGTIVSEDSWVDVKLEDAKKTGMIAYRVSKVLAERALWEFKEKENPNFDVTTILPPLIFGPIFGDVKSPGDLNLSSGVFHKILTGQLPQDYTAEFVDVRDVAKAHVAAIERPEAIGKRWLLISKPFVGREFVEAVHTAGIKGTVSAVASPNDTVDVKTILSSKYTVDNSRTRKEIGFELKPLETTAVDTANDFIAKKLL